MKLPCIALLLLLALPLHVSAQQCPELAQYYDQSLEWGEVIDDLGPLLPVCLDSSEYFALLGGAQLNNGLLAEAFESLERALLLDPQNGAAQIDYAQALFEEGQLFNALQLNDQVLAREDLPEEIRPVITARAERWRSLTRNSSFHADAMIGYDNNLNGAPDPDLITLTLSGESVLLPLGDEFRPQSGPYLNLRLGNRTSWLAPLNQQHVAFEVRGRVSEDNASDLIQLDGRYSFVRPHRRYAWQIDASIRNLFFGGTALYTASETRGRINTPAIGQCRPFADATVQHQLFHKQTRLNAFDTRLSGGMNCTVSALSWPAINTLRINLSGGILNSQALRAARPGGDRTGWQISSEIVASKGVHTLRALLNHTELDDKRGYSPLLADGAARQIARGYALLQYRQPVVLFDKNVDFVINAFHQIQDSNIELFDSSDSTLEVGVSFRF